MLIKYQWRGPEERLDSPLVTAIHMSVHDVDDQETKLSAEGRFTLYDHVEGCSGEDPWVAWGTFTGGTFQWVVRRKKPEPQEFVFTKKSGEPLFCPGEETNTAIKAFIAGKLTRVVLYMRENKGSEINLVDEPERYKGPKHEYTGPCVCMEILASGVVRPFEWSKYTDGGKYPANCFKCSCNNGWYRFNPEEERWVQVVDQEAWHILTEFNGVVTESISLDPEARIPLLLLTRNLRQRGLIPIG